MAVIWRQINIYTLISRSHDADSAADLADDQSKLLLMAVDGHLDTD